MKLNALLLAYGDFSPEWVLLRGKAFQLKASEASGDWTGSTTTKETNLGLSTRGGGANAEFGHSKGSDTAENESKAGSSANNHYNPTGGNGLLNGNSDPWIQSMGVADNWRVIDYGMLTEMMDFLPEEIAQKMTMLTESSPSVQLVTNPTNTSCTMSLDGQFLRLSLKSSNLLLGVLAGAKAGDAAIIQKAADERGFNNATI